MSISSPDSRFRWSIGAFGLLLPIMLLRVVSYPVTIDSMICASSVALFRPGFMDGKPLFTFLGQIVRGLNALIGGDRATLLYLLGLWCALFAWGMLVMAFLLALHFYRGSVGRAWATVALLATSPIFAFMSAVLDKYTVSIFLLMLAVLLWLKRRYIGWGLVWGLAVAAHLVTALIAIPCAIHVLRDPTRRSDGRRILIGGLISVAASAPLYIWVLTYTRGIGAYVEALNVITFRDYSFMSSLRPGRILSEIAANPGVAAGAALLGIAGLAGLIFILGGFRRTASSDSGERSAVLPQGRRTMTAILLSLGLCGILLVGFTHRDNVVMMSDRVGLLLVALGLLQLVRTLRRSGARAGEDGVDRAHAGNDAVLLITWLVAGAVFVTMWDHFFGQFSMFVVPQFALLAAGLGYRSGAAEEGSAGGVQGRLRSNWATVLIIAAILIGAWNSRDVPRRGTWPTKEFDAFARAAAGRLTDESLVIAGWESANLRYHMPGIEVIGVIPGLRRQPRIWKGARTWDDIPGAVEEALGSGREVYVTDYWLKVPGDDFVKRTRERLLAEYTTEPVEPGLQRLRTRIE